VLIDTIDECARQLSLSVPKDDLPSAAVLTELMEIAEKDQFFSDIRTVFMTYKAI